MVKIIGAIVGMVVVAGIIVAIGMWRGLIPIPSGFLPLLVGGGERERTAQYYPPDTLAYFWATLVPGEGQLAELQDIWEQLDDSRAFRDLVDRAQDEFEEETGIDFEEGLVSWVGPEFSMGVLEADWDRDEWVVVGMVEVRDKDAAEAFLGDWLDYMEGEQYSEFYDETYRGFDIVVSEDGEQAYALTGDWLVFATSERGLEDVLARIAGEEEASLATDEHFMEARSHLASRRFASVYVLLQEAEDVLEDAVGEVLGTSGRGVAEWEGVDWIAGSTGVTEAGLVMEVAAPVGIDDPLEVADLDDPSRLLSSDTLGFVAATFDPNVDRWRAVLREIEIGEVLGPQEIDDLSGTIGFFSGSGGPHNGAGIEEEDGLDVMLDLGLSVIEAGTGIDLEDDLFDHLGGELIMAVGDVDFDASSGDFDDSRADAVVMLSYADGHKDDLSATVDDAVEQLVELSGLDTDTRDVGADDRAVVIDLEALGDESIRYQPGYVLHGGYLTVGSTVRSLEGVVDRQNGDPDALSANEEYQRALRLLPEKRQVLGYVDLHQIIRRLEADDMGLSRDEYRVLEDAIGVMAMSVYSPHCVDGSDPRSLECEVEGADVWRYSAVLTLFPE